MSFNDGIYSYSDSAHTILTGLLDQSKLKTMTELPAPIPSTVKKIATPGFNGCISLKTLTIPENVSAMDEYVFSGGTVLTQLNFLPTFVTRTGDLQLAGCPLLTRANINDPSGITFKDELGNPDGGYSWYGRIVQPGHSTESFTNFQMNSFLPVLAAAAAFFYLYQKRR